MLVETSHAPQTARTKASAAPTPRKGASRKHLVTNSSGYHNEDAGSDRAKRAERRQLRARMSEDCMAKNKSMQYRACKAQQCIDNGTMEKDRTEHTTEIRPIDIEMAKGDSAESDDKKRAQHLRQPSQSPATRKESEAGYISAIIDDCSFDDGQPRKVGLLTEAQSKFQPLHNIEEAKSIAEDDIGEPSSGEWDIIRAFKGKCCYEHGEEVLLQSASRWMRPTDFSKSDHCQDFRVLLEERLAQPSSGKGWMEAQCDGNWWNDVHAVDGKSEQNGCELYLVRWKPRWTPV